MVAVGVSSAQKVSVPSDYRTIMGAGGVMSGGYVN